MTNLLQLDQDYAKGQAGDAVELIQQWLCLHRFRLTIDKQFGSVTDAAVRMFQKMNQLTTDGIVSSKTYAALIQPMLQAIQPIVPQGRSFSEMVAAYAIQHRKADPREIGGENCGPWVRLYMQGHEGEGWPWCAGFVSFMIKQAAESLQIAKPLDTVFSCDLLVTQAKQKKLFVAGTAKLDKSRIKPGSLFILRGRKANDWVHTGIVALAFPEFFLTIEGNTNGNGSREGNEVWQVVRNYGNADFVIW